MLFSGVFLGIVKIMEQVPLWLRMLLWWKTAKLHDQQLGIIRDYRFHLNLLFSVWIDQCLREKVSTIAPFQLWHYDLAVRLLLRVLILLSQFYLAAKAILGTPLLGAALFRCFNRIRRVYRKARRIVSLFCSFVRQC